MPTPQQQQPPDFEPIENFDGFGIGASQTEYFHSQGMTKGPVGIMPGWNSVEETNSSMAPSVGLITFFARGVVNGVDLTFGVDGANQIYSTPTGTSNWTLLRGLAAGVGNGLIVDLKNRLLYARNQYLGMSTDASVTFSDTWKDFGASYSAAVPRPADAYEDIIIFGNGNALACLFSDDSFNNVAMNLPTGYTVVGVKAGRTGVLIGVNTPTKGAVFLWDGYQQRSISPWIWFNAQVKCIVSANTPSNAGYGGYNGGWYVFTARGIYFTNGYTVQPVYETFPDTYLTSPPLFGNMQPQGADLISNKLIFTSGYNGTNRLRSGVYVLNLATGLFEFAPLSNGCQLGVATGAVFFDGSNILHYSYSTNIPARYYIAKLQNNAPATSFYITEPKGQGGNIKVATGAKVTVTPDLKSVNNALPAFTMTLKVYNFKRSLWTTAVTRSTSGAGNILNINGAATSGNQVGDEVTILQGINAGLVAHITNIANPGGSSEVWTLDTTFPNNTEMSVSLVTSPFLKAQSFALTGLTQLRDLYFDIGSRYKGKKYLLKFLIQNLTSGQLEMSDGQFFLDDQGEKTS